MTGLGTVVVRSHPQPGVDLTYVKQSGESNGDAGDQYTGLDRFGRVVDQRWIKAGTAVERVQYGYDHRGRQDRTVRPTGTITRMVYDGLSRTVSVWVGTSDTPAGGRNQPQQAGWTIV